MARLPEKERYERDAKILADWKAGYSQNQLAKNYDVSPATVNKICKGVEQNNKEIVNTQVAINTELVNKSEYELNAIHKAVDEQTRRANLVFNASEKIIVKAAEMVDGVTEAAELKALSDTVDKSSLTLGVNQRHSNQQINVQTNTQVNANIDIDKMDDKEVYNTYLDMIKQ